MDRRTTRRFLAAALLTALISLPAGGCRSMATTLAYLIGSMDVPADFPGLKDKKVAVVCRPVVALQYRNADAARSLAQQISVQLQAKVPKINVIKQQKVAAWVDENTWEEYYEVGKALGADMVVGIDLTGFTIQDGQTLYRGRANATIQVCDLSKGKNGQLVFEKTLPQTVYPPNTSVPMAETSEADFRREFVSVLADQIARHFYAHDRHADVGQDSTILH